MDTQIGICVQLDEKEHKDKRHDIDNDNDNDDDIDDWKMIVHDDDNDDDSDDWRMIACNDDNDDGDDKCKMIDAAAIDGKASCSRSLIGVNKDAHQCTATGTPLFLRTEGQNEVRQSGDHSRVPSGGEWLSVKAEGACDGKSTNDDQATELDMLNLALTRFAMIDQEGIIIQHGSGARS